MLYGDDRVMDQDGATFTVLQQAFAALRVRKILDLVMGEAAAEGPGTPPQPITKDGVTEARQVSEPVRDYRVRLIAGTRDDPKPVGGGGEHLTHPVNPCGSISLGHASPPPAWLTGRDDVTLEDVVDLALEPPQSIRVV